MEDEKLCDSPRELELGQGVLWLELWAVEVAVSDELIALDVETDVLRL